MFRQVRNLLVFGQLFLLCCFAPALAAQQSFSIGVVPQFEARKIHQIWGPILQALESRTGHRFELVGSPTIPEFEVEFLEGKFDFVYMNPYHLIMANDAHGYQPIVRDIGRQLFGVLVTDKQGGISDVRQLAGKTIAFPAPNALGASLQMRQELHDLFGLEIQPRYVKTHDSVYLNVLLGQTAAGGGVQKTLNRQAANIRERLQIIHKTRPVAPHPLAAHPRVPPEVVEQVVEALLALGESDQGKALLSGIPIKKIGRCSLDDYQVLREMKLERFYVKSR